MECEAQFEALSEFGECKVRLKPCALTRVDSTNIYEQVSKSESSDTWLKVEMILFERMHLKNSLFNSVSCKQEKNLKIHSFSYRNVPTFGFIVIFFLV